jgi:hypothetical protein
MKMEAAGSCGMLVPFHQTTRHITEDNINAHHSDNLKLHTEK